eukprot:gene16737-biopygen15844
MQPWRRVTNAALEAGHQCSPGGGAPMQPWRRGTNAALEAGCLASDILRVGQSSVTVTSVLPGRSPGGRWARRRVIRSEKSSLRTTPELLNISQSQDAGVSEPKIVCCTSKGNCCTFRGELPISKYPRLPCQAGRGPATSRQRLVIMWRYEWIYV